MPEFVLNLIAGVLTLIVLSRIVGDNPAFRFVQYLFVGVSLGYGFVVLWHQVLVPSFNNIVTGITEANIANVLFFAPPFVLWLLFLPRIAGRQSGSWLANFPLALLFGVGAALSLAGALLGTLVPQILATIPRPGGDPMQTVGGVLLAIGVILSLCYFYFTVARDKGLGRLVALSGEAGRWLLMVSFGFFFAGALMTYLTALGERFEFLMYEIPGSL